MGEAVYDLHSLGWHNFQQLCLTVTREILGQTVESFLDSNDGGRDGAFSGAWARAVAKRSADDSSSNANSLARRTRTCTWPICATSCNKARRLVERGLCDVYVLMTNAGLSGTEAEKIETAYKGVGVKDVLMYGSRWICQQIQENKRLRMLVPRVYGLGDLSQILDERAYAQARALLASLRDDLSKTIRSQAGVQFSWNTIAGHVRDLEAEGVVKRRVYVRSKEHLVHYKKGRKSQPFQCTDTAQEQGALPPCLSPGI
jgi:hypothetical protein